MLCIKFPLNLQTTFNHFRSRCAILAKNLHNMRNGVCFFVARKSIVMFSHVNHLFSKTIARWKIFRPPIRMRFDRNMWEPLVNRKIVSKMEQNVQCVCVCVCVFFYALLFGSLKSHVSNICNLFFLVYWLRPYVFVHPI